MKKISHTVNTCFLWTLVWVNKIKCYVLNCIASILQYTQLVIFWYDCFTLIVGEEIQKLTAGMSTGW